MTTKITVDAHAGWPVLVTQQSSAGLYACPAQIVPAGETRDFYVHSGVDLLIHEIQPNEEAPLDNPKAAEDNPSEA